MLVRKAGSIRRGESLSCWLHGVARRTALRIRARSLRGARPATVEPSTDGGAASTALHEAMQIFDEELTRLPQSYRAPLILCCLDGKTHDEAARQLGWTLGAFRGRLERARDKLRVRLTRRGISVPAALVGLGVGATVTVPVSLVDASVKSASLVVGGQAPGHSAAVVQAAGGVCHAMFVHKVKSIGVALGVVLVIGVAGMTLVPGIGGPGPKVAAGDDPVRVPAPDAEIEKLVKQLGSARFTEREAAQAKLREIGRAAMPAVRAGTKDGNAEITRRCTALLPLMQVDVLKRLDHPVWARFKKIVGGDEVSRNLFLEMIDDPRRAELLEAAETNPDKAGDHYRAELNRRVAELNLGYKEAEKAAGGRTGVIWPTRGIPTAGEFGTLLFLGTYPASAAVTFKQENDHDRVSHHNVFGLG